jgi:hypothetical protein
MGPTLQRLYQEYDNAEQRIILASASFTSDQSTSGGQPTSVSPVGQKIQALIPNDAKINLETNGCLPLFILLRVSCKFTCIGLAHLMIYYFSHLFLDLNSSKLYSLNHA